MAQLLPHVAEKNSVLVLQTKDVNFGRLSFPQTGLRFPALHSLRQISASRKRPVELFLSIKSCKQIPTLNTTRYLNTLLQITLQQNISENLLLSHNSCSSEEKMLEVLCDVAGKRLLGHSEMGQGGGLIDLQQPVMQSVPDFIHPSMSPASNCPPGGFRKKIPRTFRR